LLIAALLFSAQAQAAKKKRPKTNKPKVESKAKPEKAPKQDQKEEEEEDDEAEQTPPPSPAEKKAPAPPPSATPTQVPSQKPTEWRPVAIDVQLGVRLFMRDLSLYDDVFGVFFPHRQPFAAAPSLRAQWFPGAHFTTGIGAAFGVHAFASFAPGLSVRAPDASRRTVTAYEAGGGISGRFAHPRFEIRADFGFLGQQFSFSEPAQQTTPLAISVLYLALRPALNLRVKVIDRLHLTLEGGYRIVISSVQTLFPRVTTGGFDAAIGAAVPLGLGFEIRGTFDYQHYFFAMNPSPGDRYVLGGALDQYIGGTLSLAFRY
jgi:hypothetical protein